MSPWPDELPDWEDCPLCGWPIDECECIWARDNYMTRKIKVKITDDKEFSEEKEGLGLKKVFKSVAGSAPKGTTHLRVEYTNRKGTSINRLVKIPKNINN